MKTFSRNVRAAALACALVATNIPSAFAQTISFVATGDPQYGFYPDWIRDNRTTPTLSGMAKLLRLCGDCTKVMVVAGDLAHDDNVAAGTAGKNTRTYGEVHYKIEARGVKIFDGLGNHDGNKFAANWVTFTSLMGLHHRGKLAREDRTKHLSQLDIAKLSAASFQQEGWKIYDYHKSFVDNDVIASASAMGDRSEESCKKRSRDCNATTACGGFRFQDAFYCTNRSAYYYAMELRNPASDSEDSVIMVQLHNYIYSKTATDYLQRIFDKLEAEERLDVPVILVGHQHAGAETARFRNIASRMNVAALLYGHYSCLQGRPETKKHGHCDFNDIQQELVDRDPRMRNMHGIMVPRINTNAALHNIFWGVQIQPALGQIKFVRFNRGAMVTFLKDRVKSGSMQSLMNSMLKLDVRAINIPPGIPHFVICDYAKTDRECWYGP